MLKALKLITVLLVLTASANLVLSARAIAHETGEPHQENSAAVSDTSQSNQYWEFETPKGASLTILTRRALQLYDQANEALSLSDAGIVFAETNIVQKLGSRLLEIGEKVKIDSALIAEFAQKSTTLSQKQKQAWQFYADKANFNLSYIKPLSTAKDQEDVQPPKSDKSEQPDNLDQMKMSAQKPSADQKKDQKTTNGLWWLISISTIAILYYLARGEAPKNWQ